MARNMAGVGDEITAALLIAIRVKAKGLQCNCWAGRFRAGFLAKMPLHNVVSTGRNNIVHHPFETRLKFLEIA
jgi:hypothetical protein